MTTAPRVAARRHLASIRRAAPRELPQIARIVVASAVSWMVADLLGAPDPPLYAVLVPLLATRDDPYAAFSVSWGRVVGVFAGVLIGVAVVDLLPTNLGSGILLIAVSLSVGMVLRVGGSLNVQVAVSAFIIFAFEASTGRDLAWTRLWETVVGAAVTILLAPLLLPPNPVRLLEQRLRDLGAELHDALVTLVAMPRHDDRYEHLVDTARALAADERQAHRSLRFNPLQRRLLPALVALHDRINLAGLLAVYTSALAMDLDDLTVRYGDDAVARRRSALPAIAEPLADAIRAELSGGRDEAELRRTEQALAADIAADARPMAVVSRHPLVRMHSALVPTAT